MRIVQIIDSLEAGGAERMAVNYANALSEKIEFSGLIASRKEGLLVSQIDKKVSYLFLNKKKRIDFKAIFKLRRYINNNKVNIIHAHSSSFFIALLVKLTLPKIKIIWHDHYGISQDLKSRRNFALKFGSLFFEGSIAVSSALKNWAESYLWCENIIYFPNFVHEITGLDEELLLNGEEGKRIVCVANLRPQKNHELLIKVANIIRKEYPDWTFHLFGKDFLDDHSKELKRLIRDLRLYENIFFYGTVNNVASILKQCDIAVLPSISEGLPLAILEYGLSKLPVVATNVGEISTIIISEKEGLIVESNNINQFSHSIQKLIRDEKLRITMGSELNKMVNLNYSRESIVRDYISWLNYLINFTPSKHI
ncbi:glycosyltransferase family 4 protein [Flavobacterium sp. ALJ2]|uniref:glycosyltransferase family 4 protein n=1 Tax=Flavobacterium sp. ALJ2 TaxID=2786960 RepID=UPI00189FF248|nr:glycosyltransferase family 4 protein [Flavobacterium sp. ALJ2]MBF7090605.1 glycosyltransferase family 4 protein [Flavobacterium sp. ALJ2]